MKLARRLILTVSVLLALSLAVGGWAVVRGTFRAELDAAVTAAQEDMKLFSTTVQALCLHEDGGSDPDARLMELLRRSATLQALPYRVLDGEGLPLAWGGALPPAAPPEDGGVIETRLLRDGNRVWLLSGQRLTLLGRGYVLQRGREVGEVFDRAESNLRTYALVMLAVLSVSVGLTTAYTLWTTRPIRRISRTARQLADGHYEKRVALHGDDELAGLARDFNTMADALERKISELEDAARRQREFTASFAHELKTPLTSVIGYADTLRSRNLPPARQLEAAGYIFSEGRRLEAMSFALLDLFSLDREAPKTAPVRVEKLFETARRSTEYLLRADGLTLETRCGDESVSVNADLVGTLLLNLLDNARKASPRGGVLTLESTAADGERRLTVIDRGAGIPPEALARITEPFYMVDKSRARAQGGAGLGLALCRRIAEVHGGRLEFESQVGEGTKASLVLGELRDKR